MRALFTIYRKHPTALASLSALCLGALLTLSFAPYNIFPFAVLAPAGLMLLILESTPKRAAFLGLLFGVGLFATGIYWIFISIHRYGNLPVSAATALTAAMILILALYYSATCYLTQRYFSQQSITKQLLAFSALWVLLEWLRSTLFSGFPWLLIGYSQTNSPLRGFAPLFSVYGVSFAVLASANLLVHTYRSYQANDKSNTFKALYILLGIWTLGALLAFIPWTEPHGKPLKVSLVQGNIPQEIKWSRAHISDSLSRYQKLSESEWGKSDLIVWPEAALPASLQYLSFFIDKLDVKARTTNTQLILGLPIEKGYDSYFNALISLGNDLNLYKKRHLVPFGEYIPFKEKLGPVFDFLHVPMSNMTAGHDNQDSFIVGKHKILPSICYEIAFPQLMRSEDRNIGLILAATNDAWFGHSSAQAQHLQMTQMRAIELARPALFIGNDGITSIISAKGTILQSAPAHQATVLRGEVQPVYGLTPWMTNGIDPILFIILCVLLGCKYDLAKRKNDELLLKIK